MKSHELFAKINENHSPDDPPEIDHFAGGMTQVRTTVEELCHKEGTYFLVNRSGQSLNYSENCFSCLLAYKLPVIGNLTLKYSAVIV